MHLGWQEKQRMSSFTLRLRDQYTSPHKGIRKKQIPCNWYCIITQKKCNINRKQNEMWDQIATMWPLEQFRLNSKVTFKLFCLARKLAFVENKSLLCRKWFYYFSVLTKHVLKMNIYIYICSPNNTPSNAITRARTNFCKFLGITNMNSSRYQITVYIWTKEKTC